jgi:uncharacterized protein YbaA (DUF1428 family)
VDAAATNGLDAAAYSGVRRFFAAESRMHEDPRLDGSGEPPFDATRLILGCFAPVFSMGRA